MNAAAMEATTNQNEPSLMYMDVKVEAIMPRVCAIRSFACERCLANLILSFFFTLFQVIIESAIDAPTQRDRPKTMQIQISRFALTNIRETGSSRADLANALHSLQEGTLVFASGFPSKTDDLSVVTDRILSHVSGKKIRMGEEWCGEIEGARYDGKKSERERDGQRGKIK